MALEQKALYLESFSSMQQPWFGDHWYVAKIRKQQQLGQPSGASDSLLHTVFPGGNDTPKGNPWISGVAKTQNLDLN